jgi:hypothetical protein
VAGVHYHGLDVTGWSCHPGDVELVHDAGPISGTMIASILRRRPLRNTSGAGVTGLKTEEAIKAILVNGRPQGLIIALLDKTSLLKASYEA